MARRDGPAESVDRASASLEVYLLGRFEVFRGDAPIPAQSWRRRRPADLLKLVALTPGRSLPRDRVIEVLWPDKDPASGANNLHRALYDLRQVLGGRWIDLEQGVVRMRADVWVDVDAFEAAVADDGSDDLLEALALYRGDLSPEDTESPWLQPRRLALRRAFAAAAFPVARAAAERTERTTAIPLLRRVLAVEPANEEAHRLLMRLLAESGRRADALRQYDICELALRSAGPAAPSEETRALRDAVQHGRIGPGQARPPFDGYRHACQRLLGLAEPAPLRGRAATLLLLESLVEQGAGTLVLLGEQGVGKTRLAIEGARIAQERGALVLTGRAATAGSTPFGLFADAWADHQQAHGLPAEHDLLADLAAGQPAAPDAHRLRHLEAVQGWLASVAGTRAVYLLCEDIHLADESSLNLLHWLARQAKALKLMVVSTCREDLVRAGSPIQMHLSHLDCERLGRGIRVQRLTLAATREQIADILEAPPADALAVRIYRITDGSPFYTEEVARAFHESGHLVVPGSPTEAIRTRLARLGSKVEAVLAAAGVVGRHFDFDVVRAVAGLTAHESLTALDRCLEARVIEEEGAGYHFHHSAVRDAVYENLGPTSRERLHRSVADALEARTAAGDAREIPEQLAHHRLAAMQPAAAARHFVAAGHRAAARAGLSEALGCYEKAFELADAAQIVAAERLELLEAMGRVQLGLADLSGLDRTFEMAAELAQRSGLALQRGRARRLQAVGLAAGGHFEAAQAHIDEAVAEQGRGDEAAEMLHLGALVSWHMGDPHRAMQVADRSADEAAYAGDLDLAAEARETSALARASLGSEEPPPEKGERCAEPGDPPFDLHLVLWTGVLARGSRPLVELQTEAALAGNRARRRGDVRGLAAGLAVEGAVALEAARWDVAEAALRDSAGLYRSIGCGLGESFALDRLGLLLTVRGRFDEGRTALGAGILAAERAMLRRHALARLHGTLARNRLAAGALYAAEDSLREASATAARHGPCIACDAMLHSEAVRVALARGNLQQADGEAEALGLLAAARSGAALGALARVARARVLAARGAVDGALELLDEARKAFVELGASYEAARCLIIRAQALRGAGPARAMQAERLAREAEAALEDLGASPADA